MPINGGIARQCRAAKWVMPQVCATQTDGCRPQTWKQCRRRSFRICQSGSWVVFSSLDCVRHLYVDLFLVFVMRHAPHDTTQGDAPPTLHPLGAPLIRNKCSYCSRDCSSVLVHNMCDHPRVLLTSAPPLPRHATHNPQTNIPYER